MKEVILLKTKPSNLVLITMSVLAVNTVAMIAAGCVMVIESAFKIFKGQDE